MHVYRGCVFCKLFEEQILCISKLTKKLNNIHFQKNWLQRFVHLRIKIV